MIQQSVGDFYDSDSQTFDSASVLKLLHAASVNVFGILCEFRNSSACVPDSIVQYVYRTWFTWSSICSGQLWFCQLFSILCFRDSAYVLYKTSVIQHLVLPWFGFCTVQYFRDSASCTVQDFYDSASWLLLPWFSISNRLPSFSICARLPRFRMCPVCPEFRNPASGTCVPALCESASV